ncbi:MAG: Kelch repeat-containing protein, partial [Planctomycetota bacterium]
MTTGDWSTIAFGATKPSTRGYGLLQYDASNSKLLLFGGYNGSVLSDTWSYDTGANTWASLSPATSPSARYAMAACLHSNTICMFGGYTGGADIQDLWTWNGTNWVETTLSGASLPVARKWAAMASDGNTAIILWGGDVNGTLDDSVWVINPTTGETGENIPEFPRPEARKMHSMYYDSLQDAVIMFGGRSMVDNEPLNDAWSYKNSAWTPLEVSAEFVARAANHNVAYDTAKHRTLIAPGGMIARGSITPMRGARYKDNDAFDLDDGQNPAITIEHIKVFEPRRVTNWADSYLKFDLETLLGSTDQSGTSIRFECIPTATSGTAVSYYSGGKNMVDTADLLGQTPPPSTQQEDYIVSLVPAQPDFIKI